MNERAKEDYLFHEKVVVDAAVKNINTQIIRNLSDLAYIKDTYIRSLSKNQQQHDLLSLWSLFSENQIIYHKIRFIDLAANEIYRIDHDETGSYVVYELQNKANRPFFYETIGLDENMFYISVFDLNIENNQVRLPIIPTIRVAQPVFVDQIVQGIIVLNYDAHLLLDTFESDMLISNAEHVYLLNESGEYIFNSSQHDLDWDFMFNQSRSFQSEHPEVYKEIVKNDQSTIYHEGKFYYYSHVLHFNHLNLNSQNIEIEDIKTAEDWFVVTEIDEAKIPYQAWNGFYDFLFDFNRSTLLLSFILFNALGLSLYFYFINRINTEHLVKYDYMTGAYTRLQGLKVAEERFNQMLSNHHKVTIVFADLNGLKDINDRFGHQIGDEAIHKFALAIVKNIRFKQRTYLHEFLMRKLSSSFRKYFKFREDDIFVRLGGDEFLYMCFDVADDDFNQIVQRVNQDIESQSVEDFVLSASAGVIIVTDDVEIDFETALNLADHAMYDDKMRYYKKVNKEIL